MALHFYYVKEIYQIKKQILLSFVKSYLGLVSSA